MLAVLALLCAVLSALLLIHVQRRLRVLQRQQHRNTAAVHERQIVAELRAQLALGQTVAENVVEGGTSTVRAVHKGIASIPFGILESIPVTRDTTRVVRRIHDAISDSVYGGISATNKALHQEVRESTSADVKSSASDAAKELPNDLHGDSPKNS